MVDADGVYRKVGPARVFTTEKAAIAAIKSRGPDRLQAGDVLVLIGRGPMGAGMEEIYQITSALKHLSFGKYVTVLTDARFSGVSTGACIGHIGPEALAGGPIGKVRDGDRIAVTIDRNRLEGSIDFVGEGETILGPEEGSRVLARRPFGRTSPRTPIFPTTHGSGQRCSASAAVRGAAACSMWMPSWPSCKLSCATTDRAAVRSPYRQRAGEALREELNCLLCLQPGKQFVARYVYISILHTKEHMCLSVYKNATFDKFPKKGLTG